MKFKVFGATIGKRLFNKTVGNDKVRVGTRSSSVDTPIGKVVVTKRRSRLKFRKFF